MLVSILFDAFIVLVAVLGIVIGLKQGFVKMFILRFRKLASAVIAVFLAKPFGAILTKYFLAEKTVTFIMDKAGITDMPAESVEALKASVPPFLEVVANLFHYDLNALAVTAYANGQGMQEALIRELSYPIASFVSVVLVFIVLYFVFSLGIKLLGGMIENVFELPVLKQINAICGALVGLVLNASAIWVVCQLVGWLLTTDLVAGWTFMEGFSIEGTLIAKYIYHFNPLAFILSVKPK